MTFARRLHGHIPCSSFCSTLALTMQLSSVILIPVSQSCTARAARAYEPAHTDGHANLLPRTAKVVRNSTSCSTTSRTQNTTLITTSKTAYAAWLLVPCARTITRTLHSACCCRCSLSDVVAKHKCYQCKRQPGSASLKEQCRATVKHDDRLLWIPMLSGQAGSASMPAQFSDACPRMDPLASTINISEVVLPQPAGGSNPFHSSSTQLRCRQGVGCHPLVQRCSRSAQLLRDCSVCRHQGPELSTCVHRWATCMGSCTATGCKPHEAPPHPQPLTARACWGDLRIACVADELHNSQDGCAKAEAAERGAQGMAQAALDGALHTVALHIA